VIEIVEKIIDLLGKGLDFSKPLLNKALAEGPQKGRRERLENWQDALAIDEPDVRGNRLHGLVAELCIAGGQLPGDVPNKGPVAEVPLSHLNALYELGAEAVAVKEVLERVDHALRESVANGGKP